MTEAVLTAERILEAAEEVLRRFGPAKATVVDVARALGVSHGSVYRYFPTKADLRDAVTERWLARISSPLEAVAARKGPAPQRLRRWLDHLVAAKRSKAHEDPELFAHYVQPATEAREVVRAHVEHLIGQMAGIIADGIESGEFDPADPVAAGRAVFDAAASFDNPVHAAEWSDSDIEDAYRRVVSLVLSGLGARTARAGRQVARPSSTSGSSPEPEARFRRADPGTCAWRIRP